MSKRTIYLSGLIVAAAILQLVLLLLPASSRDRPTNGRKSEVSPASTPAPAAPITAIKPHVQRPSEAPGSPSTRQLTKTGEVDERATGTWALGTIHDSSLAALGSISHRITEQSDTEVTYEIELSAEQRQQLSTSMQEQRMRDAAEFSALERSWTSDTPDRAWTQNVQAQLSTRVQEDQIGVQVRDVDCRTTICRIEIDGDSTEELLKLRGLAEGMDARWQARDDSSTTAIELYLQREDDAEGGPAEQIKRSATPDLAEELEATIGGTEPP
jgi:hypothetical protein